MSFTPQETDWPHAGDPSAADLMPQHRASAYVKFDERDGAGVTPVDQVIALANAWFSTNFATRLMPEVARDPHTPWFLVISWPVTRPNDRTLSFAQGIVTGLMVAAGHEIR